MEFYPESQQSAIGGGELGFCLHLSDKHPQSPEVAEESKSQHHCVSVSYLKGAGTLK